MDDQQLTQEIEETQQEQQEDVAQGQGLQVVNEKPLAAGDSLTVQDVSSAVDESLSVYQQHNDSAMQDLSAKVQSLGESVQLLAASEQQQEQEQDSVQLIRVDPVQVETAKGALRLLCTECLIVVIVLALIAGLQAWQVVAERWRHG